MDKTVRRALQKALLVAIYMAKKQLLCIFLLVFVSVSYFSAYGTDIPAVLEQLGYRESTLLSYDKEGTEEFFTFPDLTSGDFGDTITFVVEDGKIKQTIKGETMKFLEKSS
jgi:hypothetical protein